MNNDKKIRVTVIGNYLDPLERPLRTEDNIVCDCIISSCSPLAMTGDFDTAYSRYSDDIHMPMPALLNLRKNLSAMLSRDKDKFDQNYNLQPAGKMVRYENITDYIVVMNTSAGYSIFLKNDAVYSDTYPQNPFIEEIKADKSFVKQSFPFSESFNWRFYYEKFIDTVLNEYDKDHIILIRTNSSSWYMNEQDICAFEDKAAMFRSRVQEMDEYFIEKTSCLVIDEQYNFIPAKKEFCAFTFSSRSAGFYKQVKNDIAELMRGKADLYRQSFPQYTNTLEKTLYLRLSADVINRNSKNMELIRAEHLSLRDIEKRQLDKDNAFFADIMKLHRFLGRENTFSLSDYAISLLSDETSVTQKIDFELLDLYTKYFKLNINDIIAVYMLYSKCGNKENFRNAVLNIINNSDCIPVNSARRFRRKNISFLQNYPYIQPELLNVPEVEKLLVRVENDSYIKIDLSSGDFMEKLDLKIDKTGNYMQIIDNGYVCPIESADTLCQSYAFYIERAKRGEASRPVKILFYGIDDFSDSLWFFDYKDILTSENFVISLPDGKVNISKYEPVCDLSFLLKKNTKICIIRSGLTDQICYYIFAKKLEEENNSLLSKSEIYYDDTIYLYQAVFNGLEAHRFTKKDISHQLISNLLSVKLLNQIKANEKLPEILFKNGIVDTAIVSSETGKLDQYKLCCKVYSYIGYNKNPMSLIKRYIDFSPAFYYTLVRPEVFMLERKFDMNDYIEFPKFDERNQNIADKMLSCDAVVVHIRLGDFVSAGCDVDNDYYIESFKKLSSIPDYSNKKYFVFSDDIPYVKKHAEEYGFDLTSDSEVIYIDHNKYEESYRDLQLMTLAKVIIASGSGLVRMAAVISKRCEQVFLWKTDVLDLWEKIGKKNKYNIGAYSKNYRLDYSKWCPKSEKNKK